MNLKIKSINFTPQVLICYALLLVVICLLSFRADTKQADTSLVRDELPRKTGYTLQLVTDNSNAQTGFDVLLYDGTRQVDVIHLDSTCHLAKAILNDNQ